MKKGLRKLEREIRELSREFEEKEPLLHLSYDDLADGGRHFRERIARKVVDPETAQALRRVFC